MNPCSLLYEFWKLSASVGYMVGYRVFIGLYILGSGLGFRLLRFLV